MDPTVPYPVTLPVLEPVGPTENAFTPDWWVNRLASQLATRRALTQLYEDYYEGRFELAFASARFRKVFADTLATVSDPWMSLIVQTHAERLEVQGFRYGQKTADRKAWDIWKRNWLEFDSRLLFVEAIKHGEAYLLVWPNQVDSSKADITVEHPSQMIVARDPGDRRKRQAALKLWIDEVGNEYATLYLPNTIHRYWRPQPSKSAGETIVTGGWVPRPGVDHVSRHNLGVVPVVPIVNDPHMLPSYPPSGAVRAPYVAVGLGRSILADVLSTQDQVNKLLCDMMVASEVAAFRQRWAIGIEDIDSEEAFKAAIEEVWTTDSKDARFGEFGATEIKNYTGALENRLQSMASRTRTPPHYLLGNSGTFPSGESLKSTETGLVRASMDRQRYNGEGLQEATAIALYIEGDSKALMRRGEVDWAPAESRTESEFVDSLVKKLAIGVPFQQLWQDAGYSQQQIDGFGTMLREFATEFPQWAQQMPLPGNRNDNATGGAPAAREGGAPVAP